MQRAIVAITDAGREVETSDATAGIVISKWFSPDGIAGDQERHRIRVTVGDDGKYEVAALCQHKSGSGWDDGCGETAKRPRFVVETIGKVDAAMK